MERSEAYRYLADWFEYLNDDCDYEVWSQYFVSLLKEKKAEKVLDVGCGSGYFTRAFSRAGFDSTGVDSSLPMLEKAEFLSREEGVRCRFLSGNIVHFKTHEKFDVVISINDCFNYIPKEELRFAFKSVAAALKKNGTFVFDISSERKYRKKIADTVSVDDRDDVTYLSFNSLEGDKAVLDVSLFVREKDGKYARFDERHVQYVYTEEEVVCALKQSGFTLEKVSGHLGEEKETSDRLLFVARK